MSPDFNCVDPLFADLGHEFSQVTAVAFVVSQVATLNHIQQKLTGTLN